MSAGKRIKSRPLMTGWRPSDRNDLVVWVMVVTLKGREWVDGNDIRKAIEEHPKLRMWWDYLPSYKRGVQQTIYLSTQNVESRLRHVNEKRNVLMRRTHDHDGHYCGPIYAIITPELREKMHRELRDRLRIPDDIREEAFISAGSIGIEVETRVGPSDDPEYAASATLIVRTKRGELTHIMDVGLNIRDSQIREAWEELLVEAGLRTPTEEDE